MTKYSEEELIEELQRVSEEHCDGGSPRVKDMKKHGEISYATFQNRFGSWNKALEYVGFSKNSRGRGNKIDKDKIIEDIKKVADICNECPSYFQYQNNGNFSIVTVRKKFGSWWKALSESGFEEYENKDSSESQSLIPKEDLIEEFDRVASDLGKIPTKSEIDKHSKYSSSVYQYRFNSWLKIIEKSKFNLRKSRKGIEISEEELLDELKKVIINIGNNNSTQEIISKTDYSKKAYTNKFGTINNAIKKIGYEPFIRRDSPGQKELIKDIKGIYRCYCDKDETPNQKLYMEYAKYNRNWVRNEFGSWNNAVEKAGFEPNKKINDGWEALKGEDHPLWKGGVSRVKYYGPSWWRRKKKVRKRDGNNCRICGVNSKEKYNLKPDVHHITPADYWMVENEHKKMNHPRNLISLCKACHKPLEGKFKGRNHEEFEKLAKNYLNIECEERQEVKQSLFDY